MTLFMPSSPLFFPIGQTATRARNSKTCGCRTYNQCMNPICFCFPFLRDWQLACPVVVLLFCVALHRLDLVEYLTSCFNVRNVISLSIFSASRLTSFYLSSLLPMCSFPCVFLSLFFLCLWAGSCKCRTASLMTRTTTPSAEHNHISPSLKSPMLMILMYVCVCLSVFVCLCLCLAVRVTVCVCLCISVCDAISRCSSCLVLLFKQFNIQSHHIIFPIPGCRFGSTTFLT
jgi:hypothetical protein